MEKYKSPSIMCDLWSKGVCSCQESYIGETVRNVEIRWQEHEDIQKDSKPAKHLKNNSTQLGKFFSQSHQLDVLGKTWKHQ